MGVTTDAKLFYGILIEEGSDAHERIENFAEDDDANESNSQLGYFAFMGNEDGGVQTVYHCSDSYTMRAIAVSDSIVIAHRGQPREIASLAIGEDWNAQLRTACEKYRIDWKQPQWWLASYWG
jgi:hypothetical protein